MSCLARGYQSAKVLHRQRICKFSEWFFCQIIHLFDSVRTNSFSDYFVCVQTSSEQIFSSFDAKFLPFDAKISSFGAKFSSFGARSLAEGKTTPSPLFKESPRCTSRSRKVPDAPAAPLRSRGGGRGGVCNSHTEVK